MNFFKNLFKRSQAKDSSSPNQIGRNDPCHCGSGKKFKNCHLQEFEENQSRAEENKRHQKLQDEFATYKITGKVSIANRGLKKAAQFLENMKKKK